MRIRLSTLKGYMNAMAKWVQTHVGRDIRYHPTTALPDAPSDYWEHHTMFQNIYADTKAWEGIPNRQDPVTKSMINYLRSKISHPHSLTSALCDFGVCACQTGWRGIEWLQPVNPRRSGELKFYEYDAASSKFTNLIYACCREDFRFKDKNGKRIKDPFLVHIDKVTVCTVRWRFQKNLQHGQEIDFQASPNNPKWCFVQAVLRIIARFKLFCSRPNTPVALYLRNPGSTTCDWLTKRGVESKLRLAAWKLFYPDGTWDKTLAKISVHSSRVQAAVFLFEAKASESVITGRLRHQSNCYSVYYCNTPMLAKLHAEAVEDSGLTQYSVETGIADNDEEG